MKSIIESIRKSKSYQKGFTKADLQYGDIAVTFDNQVMFWDGVHFLYRNGHIGSGFYTDDLFYGREREKYHSLDIVKIYRPIRILPDAKFDYIELYIKRLKPIWVRDKN